MVGLISLLVIGPQRLPKVARLAGFWIGKARSTAASVKREIKEELHAEEIRQALMEQSPTGELRKLAKETSETVSNLSGPVKDAAKPFDAVLKHKRRSPPKPANGE